MITDKIRSQLVEAMAVSWQKEREVLQLQAALNAVVAAEREAAEAEAKKEAEDEGKVTKSAS